MEGSCLISVTAPREGAVREDFPMPNSMEDRIKWWTDSEQIIKRFRSDAQSTYYARDAFPILNSNLGPVGHSFQFFQYNKFHTECRSRLALATGDILSLAAN